MNDKIKTSQIIFLVSSFIAGSTLLLTMIDSISRQDSWMIIIFGFIVCIPLLLVYAFFAKRFPGKNLIQMNDIIFGKIIGKAISIIYISYFFLLLSFNLSAVGDFYNGYIMPETPKLVFVLAFVLIGAFAVKRGIAAIAKVSLIAIIFTIGAVFITTILLIGEMDFSNFLPMFDQPVITYVQSTQVLVELPFLEIVALLMIIPHLKNNQKFGRALILGTAIIAMIFFVIVIRDTAVLGDSTGIFADNSFEAVRLINIGEFLTRIELLIALNYTTSLFIKICVLYYVTVTALSHFIGIKDPSSLILPLGGIAIIFALHQADSSIAHNIWGFGYAQVFSFPCTVFLPLLAFIVAKIRKLGVQIKPVLNHPQTRKHK